MSLDPYGRRVQAVPREAHGQAPSTHPLSGAGAVGCPRDTRHVGWSRVLLLGPGSPGLAPGSPINFQFAVNTGQAPSNSRTNSQIPGTPPVCKFQTRAPPVNSE